MSTIFQDVSKILRQKSKRGTEIWPRSLPSIKVGPLLRKEEEMVQIDGGAKVMVEGGVSGFDKQQVFFWERLFSAFDWYF